VNLASFGGVSLVLGASTAKSDKGLTRSIFYSGESCVDNGDTLSVDADLVVTSGSIEMIKTSGEAQMTMSITSNDVVVGLAGAAGNSVVFKGGEDVADSGSLTIDSTKLTLKGNLSSSDFDAGLTVGVRAAKLSVLGGINVVSGAGTDSFLLDADGTVAKASVIDLGGTDSANDFAQDISITGKSGNSAFTGTVADGLIFTSALTVRGASAVDGMEETLDINCVSVGGDLVANFGATVTTVTIDNLLAKGALNINTGDGNDLVKFETRSLYGISTITKFAAIQLGAGDDRIEIGDSVESTDAAADVKYRNNQVSFLAGLEADGGTGANTKNEILSCNDFKAGFPVTTPNL
jgi:hypothetical protein